MDLPINHFIICNINYIYDHKKFAKGVIVFKIASIMAAIGFGVSQSNGKGFALNKPVFFFKFGNLYLLANNAPKCHFCLSTSHMRANCPFKIFFFVVAAIKPVILKPIALILCAIIVGKPVILKATVFI